MPTTLSYDPTRRDFLINAKGLMKHLEKHEGAIPDHIPAFPCQSGALDQLLGQGAPDLRKGHVALYLCDHCGGYNGSIGLKINILETEVHWTDLGFHEDFEDGQSWLFEKVRGFKFNRHQYEEKIKDLAI